MHFIPLIVALLFSATAARAESWRTYENGRFGTTIDYPARFLPSAPDETNSGRSFTSSDGASLSVWGSHNSLDHDVAEAEAFSRKALVDDRALITYSARGVDWFVLSGTQGDKTFYMRQLVQNRTADVHGFKIEYPARLDKVYDAIVTRMSRSLRSRPVSLSLVANPNSARLENLSQLPKDMVGDWSNSDKTCSSEAGPDEAIIYSITPKYVSYYEIECLIQDASSADDQVNLNLDCFKGGGIRYFDKLRIQKQSTDRLLLTFGKQGHTEMIRRCSSQPTQAVQRSATKKSQWLHNGSVVSFEELDGHLEIYYVKPRPGLAAVGVREETMLFLGTRSRNSIEGTAYSFNSRCGPLAYEVRGEVLNSGRSVLLTGLVPSRVTQNCDVADKKTEQLRFELIR